MFGINDNQNDNPQTGDSPAEEPTTAKSPPVMNDEPPIDSSSSKPAAPPSGSDDLINIKGQALTSLSPLVNHLEQTPEERFKTLMMLIQASDNANFIKEAYEAANKISDEKIRAQALLDVINEINYFTQKASK